MRVIAGSLGGRSFVSPHGHRTHPMSEKVRGSLFAVLGDVTGLTVLDAFAGSGALSIEAISRGAATAVAIDADKRAHTTLKENIQTLGVADKIKATRAFIAAWSTRHQSDHFDLILADPPYDHVPYKDLERLPRHLSSRGTLVLSWPSKLRLPDFGDLQLAQAKDYGDAHLVFYKKVS